MQTVKILQTRAPDARHIPVTLWAPSESSHCPRQTSAKCFLKDIFLSVFLLTFKAALLEPKSTQCYEVKGLHNNTHHNTTQLLLYPGHFYTNICNSKMELDWIQPLLTFPFQEDILIKHMLDTFWDCINDHKTKKV